MGNMTNVLDKDSFQIRTLGIKTIVYLSPQRFEHIDNMEGITSYFHQVKESEKPLIEIDQIVEQILIDIGTSAKRPVLIFDISGMLSAAICIKVMLETNKAWSREIATAFIINKRYEAKDIPPWLYS